MADSSQASRPSCSHLSSTHALNSGRRSAGIMRSTMFFIRATARLIFSSYPEAFISPFTRSADCPSFDSITRRLSPCARERASFSLRIAASTVSISSSLSPNLSRNSSTFCSSERTKESAGFSGSE